MSYKYYTVWEKDPSEKNNKRRVYTFDNEVAAHELVEFIIQRDFMNTDLIVEEYEAPTKL